MAKQAVERRRSTPSPPHGVESSASPVTLTVSVGPRAPHGPFAIVRRWPIILLCAATLVVQSLAGAPISLWLFAYVCFVPWLVGLCTSSRPRSVYVMSYVLGVSFFLLNIGWLRFSTPPGYVAACLWSGVHYLVAAWLMRHAYRRRGLPLALVVPVIWTASELIRSRTPLSFPWMLLGHSQYRVLTMIQISDLVGAFGVSFVLAAVNGCVADLVLTFLPRIRRARAGAGRSSRQWIISAALGGGLLAATILYGRVSLARSAFGEGPRIAVLQGDYVLSVFAGDEPSPAAKRTTYERLITEAEAYKPDLFLLPETPWPMRLNREFRDIEMPVVDPEIKFARECHELFKATAAKDDAYVVTGASSYEIYPKRVYPQYEQFNSAFIYAPGADEPERYDKINVVLFGEYVPFRYGPLHSLYRRLNAMTPWGATGYEYSLTAGTEYKVFPMRVERLGRTFHFAVPICYEITIPQVVRGFVRGEDGRKRIDFLLNISNDGWFAHSFELPQHLAICAFRAVENRVGIARAVNTGISGFIDPDGRIHGVVSEPGRRPWDGITGFRVETIRTDDRYSLYSRYGDWFAYTCLVLATLCLADFAWVRARANWHERLRSGGVT